MSRGRAETQLGYFDQMLRIILILCLIGATNGLATFLQAEKQCAKAHGRLVNLQTPRKLDVAHHQHIDKPYMMFWTSGAYHDEAWRWANKQPIMGPWCGDFPMDDEFSFAVVLWSKDHKPCLDFLHKTASTAGIMCEK